VKRNGFSRFTFHVSAQGVAQALCGRTKMFIYARVKYINMNEKSLNPIEIKRNNITTGQLTFSLFFPFIIPLVILFLSGNWFWIEGWIFGVWFVALSLSATFYLYFRDPALLKERFQPIKTTNQKREQAYLIYFTGIVFLTWLAIMPLDAKRYGWTTNFPSWLQAVGAVALVLSFFFIFRSFVDNTFLSPLIRIQRERKQHVVSNGVYGFIRHPMYLGAILMFIGTPLLLGSIYGILLSIVLVVCIIARTIGEEKMLVNELEGYEEYRKKVKYRLIPFVW
jgi:protein-S-isoprenylcysteine O-methyltransferase Ste14